MPPRNPAMNRYPPQNDTVLAFAMVVAVLIGGGWFLWFKYHAQIAPVVIATQHWQMTLFAHLTDRYGALDAQLHAMDPATITAGQLFQLCHFVGLFLRIPAAMLVGLLALLCITRSAPARFTTALDLDRLFRVQAKVFRPLAVVANRKLKPVALVQGTPRPLDPALHVGEWVKIHATDARGRFDENLARSELAAQLGAVWQGPEKSAPVARCLFAAFALHAARERDASRDLLGAIAESLGGADKEGPEGPLVPLQITAAVLARADAVLADGKLTRFCREIAGRHGFTSSALMSVLWEARRKAGVLAPAEFLFTKLVDRRLWYALHGLGFPGETEALDAPPPNPRVEAIGSQAHWLAERRIRRALFVPQIEQALVSVRVRQSKAEEMSSS